MVVEDKPVGELACASTVVPTLLESPPGWLTPLPPLQHKYMPKWNASKSEEEIDNPVGWSMITFQPRYDTKKSYLGHFTPTGAQVAPANPNGERVVDGWKF